MGVQCQWSAIGQMTQIFMKFINIIVMIRIQQFRPKVQPRCPNSFQQSRMVKQKLDNHTSIKPSSGEARRKDYLFETDEEIEKEELSRELMTQTNQQRHKNTFANMACQEAPEPSPSTKAPLDFSSCYTLSISQLMPPKEGGDKLRDKMEVLDQTDCSVLSEINCINGGPTKLKPTCRSSQQKASRTRATIFEAREKRNKEQQINELPFALAEQFAVRQVQHQDGFHIVFQSDEPTECCF